MESVKLRNSVSKLLGSTFQARVHYLCNQTIAYFTDQRPNYSPSKDQRSPSILLTGVHGMPLVLQPDLHHVEGRHCEYLA